MEDSYEEMMRWALGDNYGNENMRLTPVIWKGRHPELPELKTMDNRPSGPNACYLVFQMTSYWLELNSPIKEKEDDQVKARACANPISGFTSLIKSFFVWLFKRKSRA